jgi:hypothetical protein
MIDSILKRLIYLDTDFVYLAKIMKFFHHSDTKAPSEFDENAYVYEIIGRSNWTRAQSGQNTQLFSFKQENVLNSRVQYKMRRVKNLT